MAVAPSWHTDACAWAAGSVENRSRGAEAMFG